MSAMHHPARQHWHTLLTSIRTAAPEVANLALLDAALMLIAAGRGEAAHGLLLQLVDGELRISPASACRHRLLHLLPLLSHETGLSCPALPDNAALSAKGLQTYMEDIEQEDWSQQIEDSSLTPLPLNPAWTTVPPSFVQDWLRRGKGRLNQIRAENLAWKQVADFLRDTYRLIQQLCRHGQLAETEPLFELYDQLCTALRHPRGDHVSTALTSLRLTVLVRQGQAEAARTLLRAGARKTTAYVEAVLNRPAGARLLLAGALREDFPLDEADLAAVHAALAERQQARPGDQAPDGEDWARFLAAWNDDFFAHRRRDLSYLQDYYPEQMARHNLGQPAASATELAALEQRLGRSLPPSYRRFLLTSNGWLVADGADVLLPAAEVGWLIEREPDWVAAWQEACQSPEPDDDTYFQRGAHQDVSAIRARYLKTALQISSSNEGYVLLLIPEVIDAHGEWEAWDFGVKLPGANRFQNFRDMLVAIRERNTK